MMTALRTAQAIVSVDLRKERSFFIAKYSEERSIGVMVWGWWGSDVSALNRFCGSVKERSGWGDGKRYGKRSFF
ncbi:MAG: hypothetical protein ACO31I_10170 [Prochlorotrichaceae cyanobacterium]|jgi:hypothetical protein